MLPSRLLCAGGVYSSALLLASKIGMHAALSDLDDLDDLDDRNDQNGRDAKLVVIGQQLRVGGGFATFSLCAQTVVTCAHVSDTLNPLFTSLQRIMSSRSSRRMQSGSMYARPRYCDIFATLGRPVPDSSHTQAHAGTSRFAEQRMTPLDRTASLECCA